MAEPIAFSHLNSSKGITSSIKGTGEITISSPSFVTGKFDGVNAISLPATQSGEYVGLGITGLYASGGCLSTWFKPNGWTLSGTTLSEGNLHCIINTDYDYSGDRIAGLYCYCNNGEGIVFDMLNPYSRIASTIQTISDGVWYHLALTWESAGTKTQRMFLNGNEIANGTGNIGSFSNKNRPLDVGNFRDTFPTQPWGKTIFTNFQYYNYPKVDFKDFHNKREGMNDLGILI